MILRKIPKLTTKQIFRFLSKIKLTDPKDCWEWCGNLDKKFYGVFWINKEMYKAHRVAYAHWKGDIQYTIDHLCNNKRCVNPWHLEDVTIKENVYRGFGPSSGRIKQCKHGHEYTIENTYCAPNKTRTCRKCKRIALKLYKQNKKKV